MLNKIHTGNKFGSEQVAARLNDFFKFANQYLHGELSYMRKDAAMDSIEKALHNIHKFRGSEKDFTNWIRFIVRNTCLDLGRKKGRSTYYDTADFEKTEDSRCENLAFSDEPDERKTILGNAMNVLSEKQKELIKYKTMYNYSGRDISEELGIPEQHVPQYYKVAMNKLKKEYRRLSH